MFQYQMEVKYCKFNSIPKELEMKNKSLTGTRNDKYEEKESRQLEICESHSPKQGEVASPS